MRDDCVACFGCAERKAGCHGTCEAYLAWNKRHAEELEQRRKRRGMEIQTRDYIRASLSEMKQRSAHISAEKRRKGIRKDRDD